MISASETYSAFELKQNKNALLGWSYPFRFRRNSSPTSQVIFNITISQFLIRFFTKLTLFHLISLPVVILLLISENPRLSCSGALSIRSFSATSLSTILVPLFFFSFIFFWVSIKVGNLIHCSIFQRPSYGISQNAQVVVQMGMWAPAHEHSMLPLPLIVTCSFLGAVLVVKGLYLCYFIILFSASWCFFPLTLPYHSMFCLSLEF